MTSRALLALVFCSFTIAAGCGSMDDAQPPQGDPSVAADNTELQSFAQRNAESPKPPKAEKCEGKKPKNLGQPCGCGNTWQCNGTCGGGPAIPADYGQPCGCGNTVQCNGACSGGQAIPADYDQPCGCGGRVQCDATCSIPCPL